MTRFLWTGPPWRRVVSAGAAIVLTVAVSMGAWAGYLRLTGNVHEVEPGAVYRSGQLDAAQLSALIQEKQIKTVINLRGANPGRQWYDDEVATTRRTGAEHVSLRMSANSEPDDALTAELIDVLRTAKKPYLIHCEGGADRTGLASALYERLIMNRPATQADAQLSFRYGHFPWLTSRSGAMDRTYWRIATSPVAATTQLDEAAR